MSEQELLPENHLHSSPPYYSREDKVSDLASLSMFTQFISRRMTENQCHVNVLITSHDTHSKHVLLSQALCSQQRYEVVISAMANF